MLSYLRPSAAAALRGCSGPSVARWACAVPASRAFSASAARAEEAVKLGAPAMYISNSTDPWFNLSYEDWLLRNTPVNQPILFTYRNVPCVVIGRNQNPWKETSPRSLRDMDLPLVRRRSGGGTVYHDLGNTNFSIILPRLLFTRSGGAQLVAKAIRDRLSVPSCTVNDRNDVVIRDPEPELKVSGSAYKIISHRAYHHGTMLISSELSSLGKALHSDSPNMETKGVASHRAPVSTLNAHRTGDEISHDAFVTALREEFAATYPGTMPVTVVEEKDVDLPKVWDDVADIKSWEWQYGQTPEFTNLITADLSFGRVTAHVHSRHALIQSLVLELYPLNSEASDAAQDALDRIGLALAGTRYEALEGAETILGDSVRADIAGEVLAWLRGAM